MILGCGRSLHTPKRSYRIPGENDVFLPFSGDGCGCAARASIFLETDAQLWNDQHGAGRQIDNPIGNAIGDPFFG